jgi:hypothetical protein
MRRKIWIVIIIVFLILTFGLTTYFLKYHGPESDKSEDWSHFGHYIEVYVSLASLVLIGFVSIITHEINERATKIASQNLEASKKFQRIQTMPILDLTVERSHNDFFPTYPDSWYVINCSIAAARNISVKFWMGSTESCYISLYAMGEKAKLELPWIRYASKIQLLYSDPISEAFYLFEMQNLRGTINEINTDEFNIRRQEQYFNGTDVMINFRNKFLSVKGRALTNAEYAEFFEAYRKVQ